VDAETRQAASLPRTLAATDSQSADDVFDFVLLKEAYGGDSGGAGFETSCRVLDRDTSKGQYWDFHFAGFA
jgi:hypothetical protein